MEIVELELKTAVPGALRKFYAGTLGFDVAHETADTVAFQIGATRLSFAHAADGTQPIYHFAFNIPENQFAVAKAWLAARVTLLKNGDDDEVAWTTWNAHAVYFVDSAGNIVELIARHNLPNASAAPFGSHSLLEVSEIGLAVADVASASRALQSALGIRVWDAGDGKSFTALGDERGLLIVVRAGRPWFPTDDKPAALYPVVMTMRGDEQAACTLPGTPYRFRVV